MSREPVLTASAVLGVIGAVLGLLVTTGTLSETQASGLTQALAVVVPFVLSMVTGWLARGKVTPTADPKNTLGQSLYPSAVTFPPVDRP